MKLLNSFSLNMLDKLDTLTTSREISLEEAKKIVENESIESAVGHSDTAAVFSEQLGVVVPTNRVTISLKHGERVLVGQYSGPRLQEGAKELPHGAKIKWVIVSVIDYKEITGYHCARFFLSLELWSKWALSCPETKNENFHKNVRDFVKKVEDNRDEIEIWMLEKSRKNRTMDSKQYENDDKDFFSKFAPSYKDVYLPDPAGVFCTLSIVIDALAGLLGVRRYYS